MMKLTSVTFLCCKVLFAVITIIVSISFTKTAQAQCQTSNLHQGLISATQGVSGIFGNTDQVCVINTNDASYRDFKVPTYADLENQFYSLAKTPPKKNTALANGNQTFSGNGVWLQTAADFTMGTAAGSGVQIIFVRGNLHITQDITYAAADPYSGLVFIVSGNIYIYSSPVQTVNAALISFGTICTAYETAPTPGCSLGANYTQKLTVNGSLISLNKNDVAGGTILLRRNLLDNANQSAEQINKQPKFLYILKNGLLTKDLILTQEDSSYIFPTDPAIPPPPPAASPCPGPNPLDVPTIVAVANCILGI